MSPVPPAEVAVADVRAEPVGSLLRPDRLLRARTRREDGTLEPAQFKRTEDRAVDEAVARQEQAGLPVVTDGEMRRLSFQSRMTEAVEGFGDPGLDAFLWGRWKGHREDGERVVERPGDLGVRGPLRRRRSLSAEELIYLRARTSRIPKVTLPSPVLFAPFWTPSDPPEAYPELDLFLDDVADVLREEVRELQRLGARYLQLDAPHYPLLRDEATAGWYERLGRDRAWWIERSVELENAVMAAADRVAWALHTCRGNQDSRWLAAGDYGPLARTLFGRTLADRLLLEYDDARSGGFEPLAEVPRNVVVVLGLVTTKRPETAGPDELARRVDRAARHVPLDRLAVSPQCGFATSVVGNRISPEDQARKLRTVVATAERVWGAVA